MTTYCFTIRALQPEPQQAEFNHFCAQQRVVRVERQFVADGAQSFWALCVDAAEGAGPLPDDLKRGNSRRATSATSAASVASAPDAPANRQDYKALLSEADFAVFALLRHWRKTQAEADGVPLYAVLTNEQLAQVAQRRCGTLTELAAIEGVGPARIERYGAAVLDCLASAARVPAPTDSAPALAPAA